MTRRVVLHPAAVNDIREAAQWYDHRSPGLGRFVITELRRVIDRLRQFPEVYPQIKPGIRQAAISRLPYHAIYAATDSSILLIAVLHVRRHPHVLEQQITERHPN